MESVREEPGSDVPKGPKLGMRHMQAFLLFLSIAVSMFARNSVSVSIVAMTNAETTNPNFPEYDWNEKEKSYVLSSFYWGYTVMQFPGGYLCRRIGVKRVLFIATLAIGISCLLIPLCTGWGGWQAYCCIRLAQGCFQGVLFPCIHEHIAKWSPLHERNRLGALSHTGIDFGTVVGMFTTGMIAASSIGWPGLFYVTAGICFIWCGLWLVLGADNAPASRFITSEELNYIEGSLQRNDNFHNKKIPIPWRAILTSPPFYAALLARFTNSAGISILSLVISSYYNGVLNMDIKKNAIYSALPYLTMWMLSYIFLILSDVILKHKWTSLTVLRKSLNTFAMWIPAVGLIGVGFLDESQPALAITLIVISIGVNGGTIIGSVLNTIDLSPNHAGILMGLINTAANSTLIIMPLIVSAIVVDNTDRRQWQYVFIIASSICFFGNLIYLIWGTADEQPWNAEDYLMLKSNEHSTNTNISEVGRFKISKDFEDMKGNKHIEKVL